jgi:arylsulfatase A-like enzyme
MSHTHALVLQFLAQGLGTSALIGLVFTLLLLGKSLSDFTRTGPHMTDEVLSHYRLYLAYSLSRLCFYAFSITTLLAFLGVSSYVVGLVLIDAGYRPLLAAGAGTLAALVLTGRQFVRTLLLSPGVITASSQYDMTRFYALWERLTPGRLRALDWVLFGTLGAWFGAGLLTLGRSGEWPAFWLLSAISALYVAVHRLGGWTREPGPTPRRSDRSSPNILMIGSDTLRADRLSGSGYRRELTPNLARLAARATRFNDCYVPCARTAPALASLLTGTWPHVHGVRDTFVTPEETQLPVPALPEILRGAGYHSAMVGDWAASDAEKFNFGFDHMDLPPDQWNIKYLLRQGPKDIRLFLSLFTQGLFGKVLLPEIYYLGGVPLTEEVGCDTRRMIARLAKDDAPFFLVSFMATNHPPFASKYPYYTLYAKRDYRGPSKFAMAKLRDPYEIIRRQGEPKTEFDLDQIIDLYDGCVKNFDDELQRTLDYLDASGLADNTIVVIFSDHGMEFFEHDTWGQGNSAIGDFSARVPLIIADPRRQKEQVSSQVVRTVDVAPTLLDLAGLPRPSKMEGVSLASFMRGEAPVPELPAFYETGVWLTDLPGTPDGHLRYPDLPELLEVPDKRLGMISLKPQYQDVVIAAKDRMVRLGDWKLTYQPLTGGPLYRLFNIKQDPGCRDDVLTEHPEVASRLRALLEAWIAEDPAGKAPSTRTAAEVNYSRFVGRTTL